MKKPKWHGECSAVFRQMRKDFHKINNCLLVFSKKDVLNILERDSRLPARERNAFLNQKVEMGCHVMHAKTKKSVVIGVYAEFDWQDTLCHEVAHALSSCGDRTKKHTNLTKKLYKKYFKE